jgi:ADP-ribosyl-[dinitrogen reductase] hydrolase
MTMDLADPRLLRASVLGGAVGHSLGAEIKFWSLAQIRERFPHGLTQVPLHESILDACEHGRERGIWHPPSSVHHALPRWLETQGHKSRHPFPRVGLIMDRRLQVRRAARLTCLSALQDTRKIGEPARSKSRGRGTSIRSAPIALMFPRDMVRCCAPECSPLPQGHLTG